MQLTADSDGTSAEKRHSATVHRKNSPCGRLGSGWPCGALVIVSLARLISHSCHCHFEPSQLSSGLGDPHGVDWLIINPHLDLFCALTCAVAYAGEVLEFDVIKVAQEGFICPLERFLSGTTQTFLRVTSESQRSSQCICTGGHDGLWSNACPETCIAADSDSEADSGPCYGGLGPASQPLSAPTQRQEVVLIL